MMELEQETDFFHKWEELDYWFEYRIIQRDIYGKERFIKYSSLLEEFVNM